MTSITLNCGCIITYDIHSHNIIGISLCDKHATYFQKRLKNILDELIIFDKDITFDL
jgi:hypothetical protein